MNRGFIVNKKILLLLFPLGNDKNMSVLIKGKTTSGIGSFFVSYFAICYYISTLAFILFLAFILLPGTQRIFSAWI